VIVGCLFDGNRAGTNTATSHYGGAIYSTGMAFVDQCTFINNSVLPGMPWDETRGAAIFGPASISHCIVAFNIADSGAFDQVDPDSITCTNLFGNYLGDWLGVYAGYDSLGGNLQADPIFCDTANGDYTISVSSLCAPQNNSCSTLIGVFAPVCGQLPPVIDSVWILDEDMTHVVSHTPTIAWTTTSDVPQTEFTVRFGVDDDWAFAEMWNPAPVATSDSSIAYAGALLGDGESYFGRLEVANGAGYSAPYDFVFRMNTAPGAAAPISPLSDSIVADSLPVLWTLNAADDEFDSLTYQFQLILNDSILIDSIVAELPDSTSFQPLVGLDENARFTWRVRANDSFQYGPFSDTGICSFFVDSHSQPPAASSLTAPTANPGDSIPLVEMLPVFRWTAVTDDDPMDTVRYRLELDTQASFESKQTYDAGMADSLIMIDSLGFKTHYFWRVFAYDTDSLETISSTTRDFWTWALGDFDFSHECNVADLTFFVSYLFAGGPSMRPYLIGDLTGDCSVNIADLTIMVAYLFQSESLRIGCD